MSNNCLASSLPENNSRCKEWFGGSSCSSSSSFNIIFVRISIPFLLNSLLDRYNTVVWFNSIFTMGSHLMVSFDCLANSTSFKESASFDTSLRRAFLAVLRFTFFSRDINCWLSVSSATAHVKLSGFSFIGLAGKIISFENKWESRKQNAFTHISIYPNGCVYQTCTMTHWNRCKWQNFHLSAKM